MRRMGFVATLIGVAGFFAVATSVASASSTPRWVKHVRSYPGGISNGVRAYMDPGPRAARASPRKAQSSPPPPTPLFPKTSLQTLQVNGRDSNPPVPQNETQVVHSEFNDRVAIAGAN